MATNEEIKEAYYSLAKKYHPDVPKANSTIKENETDVFRLINEAYNILSDSKTKQKYDRMIMGERYTYQQQGQYQYPNMKRSEYENKMRENR